MASRPVQPRRTNRKASAKDTEARALTPKEIEELKERLLQLRDATMGNVSFLKRDGLGPSASNEEDPEGADHDQLLSLVAFDNDALRDIEDALRRIDEGLYGICEATGQRIGVARLRALPYARYCIEAQEDMERRNGRRRLA